ncbi:MAG TPA: MFS transporter [Smithellaceae bacterium]|nr:MFS transporter [Smithella sp.]HQP25880.1 MFS transporter [Smithellaceae bacterium]
MMTFYKDPFRYRWLMLGVLGLIYFMACLHRIAPTIIAKDLVIEFGANATTLGLMASTYFYLYAAVQPPVGILSDKIGPRKVATIFALIACAGSLVFALAPNMFMAGVGRGLVGIGVGGIFVPGLKIFSGWYKPTEFATVTGIFLALGNLGNLSGSLPLTYLVMLLGWRFSFVAIAGVALPLAVLAWWILRDKPEDKGWPPIVPHPREPAPAATALPDDPSDGKGFGIIFKRSGFWMITLSYFFTSGPGLSFQGLWSVPYLMDVYGFTPLEAGGTLMALPLGFIIGSPLIGILADRLRIGRKTMLLLTLIPSVSFWCLLFLMGGKINSTFIVPLFFLIGAFGGGSLSLYMTILKELFPPRLTGTAVGFMNPAGFLAAALFQPFTGYLMDAVSRKGSAYPLAAYQNVFTVFVISMLIAFVLILLLKIPHTEQTKGR